MADSPRCPNCGAPRPADAPEGLCPRCLMRNALADETLGPDLPSTMPPPGAWGSAPDAATAPTLGPPADTAAAPDTAAIADDPTVDDGGPTGAANGLPGGATVRYFGDYEIRRELGRGGMGVVYEARQISLDRPVALKMIRSAALASDDEIRRFRNEAEAVAKLDHPHIVPIYEVGEHNGQRYFSMKLIAGPSLHKALSRFGADPRDTARLMVTVAEAVHHAHQRGILHRDLKPSNILLDDRGRPHITDFGLARRVEGDEGMTLSGAVIGTPAYMAPEQAWGKRRLVTTLSDVYGLGAVLHALLTGAAPFGGETALETLDRVRREPPMPPSRVNPKVPRDLDVICLKCLEKDPARRYVSAQAVAEDLSRYLAGEPIAARATGALERAWLWCRRNPAEAALGAAVLALVGFVVGGGLWVQRQRIEASLRRERARLAIELALEQQEDLQRRGLWEDAKVMLARAETRLDDAGSGELQRRLARAQAELDQAMRAEAEDPGIVLRLARAEAELGRAGRVEALLVRAASRQALDPNILIQCGLIWDRLGRTDQAVADFARAIDLLPRDRFFASPRSRLILELAGHEHVFSALLQARPNDKTLWIGRGRYHALRDRWRQATADYARGIEAVASLGTHEHYEYACLLLLVGDQGRYRALIRTLGDQVDQTKDPRLAYELARACIIAPEPVADPQRVIRWARLAEDSEPLAWTCHALGAAYYRAGDYDEALRWLGNAIDRHWDMGRPLNQFVLAMIHQRLGHAERAVALLGEAVRWCGDAEARRVDGAVPGVFAADWLTIQIYRREAESSITGRGTPAEPFAH